MFKTLASVAVLGASLTLAPVLAFAATGAPAPSAAQGTRSTSRAGTTPPTATSSTAMQNQNTRQTSTARERARQTRQKEQRRIRNQQDQVKSNSGISTNPARTGSSAMPPKTIKRTDENRSSIMQSPPTSTTSGSMHTGEGYQGDNGGMRSGSSRGTMSSGALNRTNHSTQGVEQMPPASSGTSGDGPR